MVSQLRIYTINRGMMDSWLKLFDEHIRPIHQGLGIPIEATWVNADRNQFIWVRRFPDGADVPTKESDFRESAGFKALGTQPGDHIAKLDGQNLEQGELAA